MNRKQELIELVGNEMNMNRHGNKVMRKEILMELCKLWELGLTDNDAARTLGVSNQTLTQWNRKWPELDELRYLCQNKTRVKARENITKAIDKGHLDTSKWFLERTDPQFQKNTDTTQVNIINVSDRENELRKFMERFTYEGVIDTVITEEREVSAVGNGTDTGALQTDKLLT